MPKRAKSGSEVQAKRQRRLKVTYEVSEMSPKVAQTTSEILDTSRDSKFSDFSITKTENTLQDDVLNNSSVCSTCFLADCECSRQDFFSQLERLNSFESETEDRKVSPSDVSIKEVFEPKFEHEPFFISVVEIVVYRPSNSSLVFMKSSRSFLCISESGEPFQPRFCQNRTGLR